MDVFPVVVVHGGAGHIPKERSEKSTAGVCAATRAGYSILRGGGSSMDAVVEAVTQLENNPAQCRGKMGTVGAVAVNSEANVACATSTGGILNKLEGRVGDVPCIGSGGYADNQVGAVSITDHGEVIMKVTLARLIPIHMEQGQSVEAASDSALAYMKSRVGGLGGVVTVDPQGRWAARFSSLQMSWAAARKDTLHYGLYAGEHFTQSIDDPL